MIQRFSAIPDAEVLLALEPEELGAKLLFLVRQREGDRHFHPANYLDELFGQMGGLEGYPRVRQAEIELAVTEAWAWLEAQALVVPQPGTNGRNGWRRLSRKARRFENEEEFLWFAAAANLPKSILHHSISEKVWL